MIYGYARVSTIRQAKDGNSLEAQQKALEAAGATQIYMDACTGTKASRPQFEKLLSEIKDGDTLVVTKLDRFARSIMQGSQLINDLILKGIKVYILNIGILDNSPSSKLIRNIFFSFAEFERDMIVERTQEGKRAAREKENYHDGRPKKYSQHQFAHAMQLLDEYSYSQVADMTGISKATLYREHIKSKNHKS